MQFSSKLTDRSAASPFASPVVTELRQRDETRGSVSESCHGLRSLRDSAARAGPLVLPCPSPAGGGGPHTPTRRSSSLIINHHDTFTLLIHEKPLQSHLGNGWPARRERGIRDTGQAEGEKRPVDGIQEDRTSGANSSKQATKFVEDSCRESPVMQFFAKLPRGSQAILPTPRRIPE